MSAVDQTRYRHRYPERVAATQRQMRAGRKSLLANYKLDSGCVDCGLRPDDPALLQLDHLRDKVAKVSSMHQSMRRLLTELEKCEVVCYPCHIKRTSWRRSEEK